MAVLAGDAASRIDLIRNVACAADEALQAKQSSDSGTARPLSSQSVRSPTMRHLKSRWSCDRRSPCPLPAGAPPRCNTCSRRVGERLLLQLHVGGHVVAGVVVRQVEHAVSHVWMPAMVMNWCLWPGARGSRWNLETVASSRFFFQLRGGEQFCDSSWSGYFF